MTVAAQAGYANFNGNGSGGPFTFNFRFFDNSQIMVTKTTASGAAALVENTDYTLAGANSQSGGAVILTGSLNAGESLMIRRILPLAQLTRYSDFSRFYAETHEQSFDFLTMLVQQLSDTLQIYIDSGTVLAAADGSGRLFKMRVASNGFDDNGAEILYPVISPL